MLHDCCYFRAIVLRRNIPTYLYFFRTLYSWFVFPIFFNVKQCMVRECVYLFVVNVKQMWRFVRFFSLFPEQLKNLWTLNENYNQQTILHSPFNFTPFFSGYGMDNTAFLSWQPLEFRFMFEMVRLRFQLNFHFIHGFSFCYFVWILNPQ